jgi:ketosteroid isomerase-like protein
MMKWFVPFVVTVLAGHAYADATAEARKHSEKFAKACEAGEIDNVLGLYADDAHVVWPGAGEEAQGKVAVEKLAKDFCDPKTELKLTLKSIDGISIDSDHIATVGHWEASSKGPDGKKGTAEVRTTEGRLRLEVHRRSRIDRPAAAEGGSRDAQGAVEEVKAETGRKRGQSAGRTE